MTQLDQSDFALDTEAASDRKTVLRAENLAFSRRTDLAEGRRLSRENLDIVSMFSTPWMSRFLHDEAVLVPPFFEETMRFKAWLLTLRENCDRYDIFESKLDARVEFVKQNKVKIFEVFDSHFRLINSIFSDMEKQFEHDVHHRRFYQYHLLPLVCTSPLNTRIYLKPLGYPGDYEIMNYYYADSYCGDTTYQMLLNRYTVEIPLARANINRRKVLANVFDELAENTSGRRKIRIASIGCGPAVELIDLIDRNFSGGRFELFCFDSEPLALKSLMKKISEKESYTSIDIHFHRLDIRRFLTNRDPNLYPLDMDLVYAAGLFDYFSDKHATLALELLSSWLTPGGKLAIVNVSKGHGYDAYLELLGEWILNARDESDILRLCEGISCSTKSVFFDPENGQNVYLILSK